MGGWLSKACSEVQLFEFVWLVASGCLKYWSGWRYDGGKSLAVSSEKKRENLGRGEGGMNEDWLSAVS